MTNPYEGWAVHVVPAITRDWQVVVLDDSGKHVQVPKHYPTAHQALEAAEGLAGWFGIDVVSDARAQRGA